MSNQLMNYHCVDGQPCGSDATLEEIADHYGYELLELAKIMKERRGKAKAKSNDN